VEWAGIAYDRAQKRVSISERACPVCQNVAKRCPDGAVRVVRLPADLDRGVSHRFGPSAFRLNGLPMPHRGFVLGLLGQNGCGKVQIPVPPRLHAQCFGTPHHVTRAAV
jgi:translation initiation factor RLI1